MFINNFDPVALTLFSFEIRWYSLAYIFGIIIGWWLGKKFIRHIQKNNNQVHEAADVLYHLLVLLSSIILFRFTFSTILFENSITMKLLLLGFCSK